MNLLRGYNVTEIEIHCWNPLCVERAKRVAVGILSEGHYATDGSFVEDNVTYHDPRCWSCHGDMEPFIYPNTYYEEG